MTITPSSTSPNSTSTPSNPFAALDAFASNSTPPPTADASEMEGVDIQNEAPEAAGKPGRSKPDPKQEAEDDSGIEETDTEKEPEFLEVNVTDEKGRRTVKVDLSDREKLSQLVARAHQAQSLLSRVNRAEDKLKKLEPELTEAKGTWAKLQSVYEEHGVEGLVDVIANKRGAYQALMEQEFNKRSARASASPEELKAMDLEDKLAQIERSHKLAQDRLQAKENEAKAQKEAADEQDTINRLTPSFAKYRFNGKLGNKTAEDMLDRQIWDSALADLEKLSEDQITQEAVDRAFRKHYTTLSSATTAKVKEKAKKVVETAKKTAGREAQAAIKGGMVAPSSAEVDKAKESVRSGDWGSFFQQALTGKVKLRR